MHGLSFVFLLTALIIFGLGTFTSRYWPGFYPSIICAGLFFYILSLAWPEISK